MWCGFYGFGRRNVLSCLAMCFGRQGVSVRGPTLEGILFCCTFELIGLILLCIVMSRGIRRGIQTHLSFITVECAIALPCPTYPLHHWVSLIHSFSLYSFFPNPSSALLVPSTINPCSISCILPSNSSNPSPSRSSTSFVTIASPASTSAITS
jgi:hypothetical protein